MFNEINNLIKKITSTPDEQSKTKNEPTEKKVSEEANVKIKETPIKQRTTQDAPEFSASADDIEKEIADAISDEDETNEQAEINYSQKDLAVNDNGMNDYIFVDIKEDNNLSTKEIQKNSEKNITYQLQPDDLNYNSTSRLKFYTDRVYKLFSGIYNIQISDLLYKSYKVVFNNNKDVAIINELIDATKSGNALTDDTICRLVNLDAEQFHLILMSQIIAKHENIHKENNFIEILSKIRTTVSAQIRQTRDKQDLNKLFKLLTLSLNRIIRETIDNITNLDKAFNFDNSIKTTEYNYKAYPITYLKNQFIKDALRKPGVCLKLMQNDQVVWDSENSKELQKLSQRLDEGSLTEKLKTDIGEKIFAIYNEQINNYLIKNNIANRKEVANLILLELTQAGVYLGANILHTSQKYLIEKLAIPEDYMGLGVLPNHQKSNILNTKDDNLVLKQPILFSPGFTVMNELGRQIATTKDINISSDLQINPNSLKNSKYDNIKLFAKK